MIASYTLGLGDGYIYSNFSEIMTVRKIGRKERHRAEPMTLSHSQAGEANDMFCGRSPTRCAVLRKRYKRDCFV